MSITWSIWKSLFINHLPNHTRGGNSNVKPHVTLINLLFHFAFYSLIALYYYFDSIYMCGLVFEWLKSHGGVEAMSKKSDLKSSALYDIVDNSREFYQWVQNLSFLSLFDISDIDFGDKCKTISQTQTNALSVLTWHAPEQWSLPRQASKCCVFCM